uniref:Transmembrane protein 209 n=2 Tax=Lygus hesperus TaxID=30085 RepID=A0A0A9Z066_LYGHE
MPIRKIPSNSSLSPKDDDLMSQVETTVFRRSVKLKVNSDINRIEEATLHVNLKRRKRDIVTWTSLNLLLILFVLGDVFHGMINLWVLRVLQSITMIVCGCNVFYYLYAFLNVQTESNNQRSRLLGNLKPSTTPASSKKMEYVRYKPHDSSVNPTYWKDFSSIFESFKRMTARNRIAFFPNDTHRLGVDVTVDSPTLEETRTGTDAKYMFSETLTKYKGRIITSARDLKQYLSDHKLAEDNEFVKTSEDSSFYQDSTDFWSGRRRNLSDNCIDISPLLRRSEYQPSPSSSDSSVCSSKETGCTNQEFFKVLRDKHMIESSDFIYWISNFRMWLSKTVLGRVTSEINVVDNGLRSLKLSGISVGNVGLDTLEDASRNPSIAHQLPSLSYLLPFLRVSTKQHYVVERFRTLAQGHGMGDFKWNVGGEIGGKPWERGYPTDAELLLHLFATYLDLQLPLSPCNSDTSKPFSSNYIAESPGAAKQRKIAIIRHSLNPPHYNLLIDGEVQEIPTGRNNLFYAVVLFLYCVKVYEHGMLGRISLGKHGIDMLWIIDDKGF